MSDTVSNQSGSEPLKTKLAALKAQRAELEAKDETADLEASIALEERLIREAQARKEAKRALGNKFAEIKTPMGLVILKRSGTGAFRAVQELEAIDLEKMEEFVSQCVFYPETEQFEKIVSELPGAIPAMFRAVSILMGAQEAETSKK